MAAIDTIASDLRALPRLAPVLEAVAGADVRVFLVGGTVRDLLLGAESFDVDLAVEGDAAVLAKRLAERLEGEMVTHGRFGTAVVRYGGGDHVDVVRARRERYAAPAALPEVQAGTIDDDLGRRDFTINAMAASIAPDDFGRLSDPSGGRRDLEAGTIRVLHDRSFVDDPSRVFRALRYEARFGFRMDPETEALARASVSAGLVGLLSGGRLREELVALLGESSGGRAIGRLAELGADRAIHPELAADAETVALAERVDGLREELDPDAPAWRLRLAVLARRIPPRELSRWLDHLALRRRDAERIERSVSLAPQLVAASDPVEIADLAEPNAPDTPLLALGLADVPALRDWFGRLRDVRLEVTGADLAELGLAESPRVGEVLDELRRRKLRGELDGREAELTAARTLIADP